MQIVLATGNAHKVEELRDLLRENNLEILSLRGLLRDADLEILSLRDFPNVEMPEETGATMMDNARLKAEAVMRATGFPALADDSGIEVDFLNGAPGVHSARWISGSDADRTNALLEKLRDVTDENRGARYRCAICVAFPNPRVLARNDEAPRRFRGRHFRRWHFDERSGLRRENRARAEGRKTGSATTRFSRSLPRPDCRASTRGARWRKFRRNGKRRFRIARAPCECCCRRCTKWRAALVKRSRKSTRSAHLPRFSSLDLMRKTFAR